MELETFEKYVQVCYLDVPDVRQLAQEDPPVINGIRVKDDEYTIQKNNLLIESKQFLDNPIVLSRGQNAYVQICTKNLGDIIKAKFYIGKVKPHKQPVSFSIVLCSFVICQFFK